MESLQLNSYEFKIDRRWFEGKKKAIYFGSNIYFDGFVYNVQISSWKQEVIAQKEVNKLVKSGFPAYKIKVYIPKFDGYWHRVRIGPFTSLQESQQILKKVNK